MTAEVTPHHLTLTDEAALTFDTHIRRSRPRSASAAEDVSRLPLTGWPTAPSMPSPPTTHPMRLHEKGTRVHGLAPPGMIGFETAFSRWSSIWSGAVTSAPLELVRRMSTNPARISERAGGSPSRSELPPTWRCWIRTRRWTYDPVKGYSKSRNSPWSGETLTGRVDGHPGRGSSRISRGSRHPASRDGPQAARSRSGHPRIGGWHRVFRGHAFGARGHGGWRGLSSTPASTGYQEILTDPSYAGSAGCAMTYTQIGNVGTSTPRMTSRRGRSFGASSPGRSSTDRATGGRVKSLVAFMRRHSACREFRWHRYPRVGPTGPGGWGPGRRAQHGRRAVKTRSRATRTCAKQERRASTDAIWWTEVTCRRGLRRGPRALWDGIRLARCLGPPGRAPSYRLVAYDFGIKRRHPATSWSSMDSTSRSFRRAPPPRQEALALRTGCGFSLQWAGRSRRGSRAFGRMCASSRPEKPHVRNLPRPPDPRPGPGR